MIPTSKYQVAGHASTRYLQLLLLEEWWRLVRSSLETQHCNAGQETGNVYVAFRQNELFHDCQLFLTAPSCAAFATSRCLCLSFSMLPMAIYYLQKINGKSWRRIIRKRFVGGGSHTLDAVCWWPGIRHPSLAASERERMNQSSWRSPQGILANKSTTHPLHLLYYCCCWSHCTTFRLFSSCLQHTQQSCNLTSRIWQQLVSWDTSMTNSNSNWREDAFANHPIEFAGTLIKMKCCCFLKKKVVIHQQQQKINSLFHFFDCSCSSSV